MNYEGLFSYFPRWITRFHIGDTAFGGESELTTDPRIRSLNQQYPVRGKRLLELGPLEGAHTLMLARLGAREVVAVEGRVENFVKCCCVRNLFDLKNCQFILQDAGTLSHQQLGFFDCCLTIGVLYHMINPAELLDRLATLTGRLFIWTHYADAAFPRHGPDQILHHCGRSYRGRAYTEGGKKDPLSGLEATAFWPFESDLAAMIHDAGFGNLKVLDKGASQNGPHCTLFAAKVG